MTRGQPQRPCLVRSVSEGHKLVELNDLLNTMDRTAANLESLEAVWARAKGLIDDPWVTSSPPEYDDLRRSWDDLLKGLRPIDGWTITDSLPDIEFGSERPGKDLAEYRYRLSRARRRAVRRRLEELTATVDRLLPTVLSGVLRDSMDVLAGPDVEQVGAAVMEIQRLLGDTTERRGRWNDLHRHMRFSQGHDWHDIHELDWPSVKADIEAAMLGETDPLPVLEIDLGLASAGDLTGAATTGLPWERLNDDGFERLLFDMLRSFPEHDNVQWLMQTRAPDRGRDLSLDRDLRDSTGSVRHERVIVQAKHWQSRSVRHTDIADTVASVTLWRPIVTVLIMATSGRFTQDAVAWTEQHNAEGKLPYIDLWPENRLETLLAQKPQIAAAHGLK
jgi:hypothetical protein